MTTDPIQVLLAERSADADEKSGDEIGESWEEIDLRPVVEGLLNGTLARPVPTVGRRSDGICLFYPARVNGVFGPSGDGKTWVAYDVADQEIAEAHHVAWLDFEDDEVGAVSRLLDLGTDPDAIIERFHYHRPMEFFGPEAQVRFRALIEQHAITLVVIDSTGESMAVDGIRPNDDDDVARWMRRFPRFIASLGPCVVLIDHVPKTSDKLLFAIGSQRKKAAITGSAFLMEATAEFGKERCGKAKLTTAKDRCGTHVRGAKAAEFTLDARVTPYLASLDPTTSASPDGAFRPTGLMEKVSRYVEAHPACTKSDIENTVPGKTAYKRMALDRLVQEGFVRSEQKGRAILHTDVRPYREADDLTLESAVEVVI